MKFLQTILFLTFSVCSFAADSDVDVLRRVVADIDSLKSQVAQLEIKLVEANAKVLSLESENQQLQDSVNSLTAERDALLLKVKELEDEIEELKNNDDTQPTFIINDPLTTIPKEGAGFYHLDAPDGWASIVSMGGRQALQLKIRKDQPLRGSNKRCKSEFGPRDNPTVETYRRFPQGKQLYFAMDIFIPDNWVRFSHKVPLWSFRSNSDEAKVSLRISGDRFYVFEEAFGDANPAVWQIPVNDIKGKWNRFVFDMVFSAGAGAKTKIYFNGTKIVDDTRPNGYPDGDLYAKFGLYVPAWSQPERSDLEAAGKLAATPTEIIIGMSNFKVGDENNKLEDFLK